MPKFPAYLLSLIVSMFLLTLAPMAAAQTAPATGGAAQASQSSAPPPEKIAELIKLLDDPDVRNWIQSRPADATAEAQREATLEVESLEAEARSRFHALRAALPRVHSEIAAAAARVHQQASERGFAPALFLVLGIVCVGAVIEWLFRRAASRAKFQSAVLTRAYVEFGPLIVFTVVATLIFMAIDWPPLVRVVVLYALLAVIAYRLFMGLCRLSLETGGMTQFQYARIRIFAAVFTLGFALWAMCRRLGVDSDVRADIVYLFSAALFLIALEAIWRRPADRNGNPPTRATNILASLYLVLLWLLWCINFTGLFWIGIYAVVLPRLLSGADRVTRAFALTRWNEDNANTPRMVLLLRGVRAIIIVLALGWLGLTWHYNPNIIARDNPYLQTLVYGVFKSAVVLLIVDLAWQLAKSYIDRKLTPAADELSVSADEAARRARLRTLLPIFRNALAAVLICIAAMTILAEMGVQIGPLIAGAGIFGVAIGFGSQTLVKDIVSGVFYLMDDAFRVGEWIESGSYNGVVESFSLRSIRLRHHRGSVFTVPFGELGAIRNGSRDWTVDKFRVRVPFKTDIAKVGKLAKEIGKQLQEDPELGPHIIKTLKMKGVEQIGEFGIEISFGFTAKPDGEQTAIRRRAYTMITQAFAENDISFAQPTFQVGGEEKEAAAAAMYKRQADAAALAAAAEGGKE
ncbi:small-conductance mechanosensitive channel [Rhizobium azooxidifex]|uniref:Small-conductance mechanosensitive channel n=1 Tax=Mycoplana azooxidifex TaxID=1636188 RepID=A0A7W6D503_9HYPH|nr:mechanosensitive ion channel family protein [Mycoplana azooxidifex]MBB3976868.1 small-conductance mechanosensitive channel [Mycoplana azooxidifex]